METMVSPPQHLEWKRHGNMPGLCGSFGDGATIQISAPEADSDRNISLLDRWLYGCINNPEHSECKRSLTGIYYDDIDGDCLPSRLIHVGSLDDSKPARIHITNGEKGRYVALSHRWGYLKKIMTIKGNLESFTESLPMHDLPLTFKDAIRVTRNLRIDYLWIDSLCIVQDDPDDWSREAAQMGSIFERAICTIAAVDSIDDDTSQDIGLFNLRRADPLAVRMSCLFDREGGLDDPPLPDDAYWDGQLKRLPCSFLAPVNRDVVLRPRWKGLWHTISDSKWHDRAWILQERILSRRMIYYTKRKIFWECQKFSNDEENRPSTVPPLRSQFASQLDKLASQTNPMNDVDYYSALDIWRYQIVEYSASQITKEADKLIAFQGLCDRIGKRLKSKVFAGVLLDNIGSDLLWSVKDEPSNCYTDFHAPSWSWAAHKGAVSYYNYHITGNLSAQVQDFQIHKPDDCLRAKNGTACQNGTCGIMSFSTSFGFAIAAGQISELRSKTNDSLIHILGSMIHSEQQPIPRRTDFANFHVADRKLSLPPQTQVLRDPEAGDIIGWYVNDKIFQPGEQQSVICASITHRRRVSGTSDSISNGAPVRGFDYANEENVDFIALKVDSDDSSIYRRIGRGRVVKKGWMNSCERRDFRIL